MTPENEENIYEDSTRQIELRLPDQTKMLVSFQP